MRVLQWAASLACRDGPEHGLFTADGKLEHTHSLGNLYIGGQSPRFSVTLRWSSPVVSLELVELLRFLCPP